MGSGTLEDLSNAIIYASDNGAKVINASWGGYGETPRVMIDAIDYAHDIKDVVFVAAAGNSSMDVGEPEFGFSPANIRDVVTVSAFNHVDERAYFSNYGGKIDVAAPGGGDEDPTGLIQQPARSILSLKSSVVNPNMAPPELVVGERYLRQAGTSMAAPHVAGVAALVRALHPEFNAEQVRQALRVGADDLFDPGFDLGSGYGRVNAEKALQILNPLTVSIDSVTRDDVLGTAVIKGAAGGQQFAKWDLVYTRKGLDEFRVIAQSTEQGAVLASWNYSLVSDGKYEIRLVGANTAGQQFISSYPFTIDNVFITSPAPRQTGLFSWPTYEIFRGSEAIKIYGTAAPANFKNYTVVINKSSTANFGGYGEPLASAKVSLVNGGNQPIRSGLLATWDTSGAPADHYLISLQVEDLNGMYHTDSAEVIVDPTLHQGWPISVDIAQPFAESLMRWRWAMWHHLNTADVNSDGKEDILIGYGDTVRIFNDKGELLPGWPQTVNPDNIVSTMDQFGVVAGDITGDGVQEIAAVNNNHQIFVWDKNGRLLSGWPRFIDGDWLNQIAIDDINADGVGEIVTSDWSGYVKVIDKDGKFLPGWPQKVTPQNPDAYPQLHPPSIGDLDGDGYKEVIVSDQFTPTNVYVFKYDGVMLPGWPKTINTEALPLQATFSYPAIGDIDGDGNDDVVLGSFTGQVFAFHADGSNVAGWPQTPATNPYDTRVSSPALGDIDNDGKIEVIAPTGKDGLFAWHGDGTLLPGWPVHFGDTPESGLYISFGPPLLADIDGDGIKDIIAAHETNFFPPFSVSAFKGDGSRVEWFPKPTRDSNAMYTNTPAVADIDGDGKLELAWVDLSANLYVWDLDSPASRQSKAWPQFQHDSMRTGNLEGTKPPRADLVIPNYNLSNLQPGSSLTISGWVVNQGAGESRSTNLKVNIDGRSDSAVSVGGIPAKNLNLFALATRWVATPGLHTLDICVDNNNKVDETNEKNNCVGSKFVIPDLAENRPQSADLFVKKFSITGLPTADTTPPIRIVAKNQGLENASPANLKLTIDRSESSLSKPLRTVRAGNQKAKRFRITPPLAPGEHFYEACAVPIIGNSADGPRADNDCIAGTFYVVNLKFSRARQAVLPMRELSPGAQGADVKKLQQFLQENAGYTGPINGRFDAQTVAALKAFQTDELGSVKATGVWDAPTRVLAEEVLGLTEPVDEESGVETSPSPTPTPSPTVTPSPTLLPTSEQSVETPAPTATQSPTQSPTPPPSSSPTPQPQQATLSITEARFTGTASLKINGAAKEFTFTLANSSGQILTGISYKAWIEQNGIKGKEVSKQITCGPGPGKVPATGCKEYGTVGATSPLTTSGSAEAKFQIVDSTGAVITQTSIPVTLTGGTSAFSPNILTAIVQGISDTFRAALTEVGYLLFGR